MISWAGSPPVRPVQATRALVSAASPGALTPSSLVTRILTVHSPYRPPSRGPGPDHPPFGSVSPARHARPGAPHPPHGPGLLQFTRHARLLAQDLHRLAHRAAVAYRARAPGG